jgi:hypothetical protein
MRGELRFAVNRALTEVWQPLLNLENCPDNLLGEVYVALSGFLDEPPAEFVRDDDGTIRDVAVRIDARAAEAAADPQVAEQLLGALSANDFPSEGSALRGFESAHETVTDLGGSVFEEVHLTLLRSFVENFNLRYYVDDAARFWVTFPGIVSVIFRELRNAALEHPHLSQELDAFEHALAECLMDPIETRIKTAIQKQFNVLEAFGTRHPAVSGNTLGRMLDEVSSWPHASMPEVGKGLYKFACDYPGIRHGGTFEAALRPLDLRDLVGVTLSLVGLAPYLSDGFEKTVVDAFFRAPSSETEFARAPWLPRAVASGTA